MAFIGVNDHSFPRLGRHLPWFSCLHQAQDIGGTALDTYPTAITQRKIYGSIMILFPSVPLGLPILVGYREGDRFPPPSLRLNLPKQLIVPPP